MRECVYVNVDNGVCEWMKGCGCEYVMMGIHAYDVHECVECE